MVKHMIGEGIVIKKDLEIESSLSDNKLQVKIGDKGYVDGNGFIHYTTGEARGKMQKISDVVLEGYDCENIARIANEHGVNVTFRKWNKMIHAFPILSPFFPEAKQAMTEICEFARNSLLDSIKD